MGRIRTVKPEFFRHEELQDLQAAKPLLNPMLVFAGLWTVCDKAGRFEWKPRQLKLDILPYLDFDMGEALEALAGIGILIRYEVGGKHYGFIPSFEDHQRITGTEAQSPARFPDPSEGNTVETLGNQPGNTQETPGQEFGRLEGKGKGKEGKGNGSTRKRGAWGDGYPPEVVELTREILAFWPYPPELQPPDLKGHRQEVPAPSAPKLAENLNRIHESGGDLDICRAIARRAVDEWRGGSWIKAPQFFFGTSEDAPCRAFYKAEVTNRRMAAGGAA